MMMLSKGGKKTPQKQSHAFWFIDVLFLKKILYNTMMRSKKIISLNSIVMK
jgi:hypothetical protein